MKRTVFFLLTALLLSSLSAATAAPPGRLTKTTYTGPAQGLEEDVIAVSAKVEDAGGAPLAGLSVTFALRAPDGFDTRIADAVTGTDGIAAASVKLRYAPGDQTIVASTSQSKRWLGSVAESPFTIVPVTSSLVLTGASSGSVNDDASLSATLTRVEGGIPLAGWQVIFSLIDGDGDVVLTASGITASDGTASATPRLNLPRGEYTRRVSFDGSLYGVGPSTASASFSIIGLSPEITYVGETSPLSNGSFNAAARLIHDVTGEHCATSCGLLTNRPMTFVLSSNGEVVDEVGAITDGNGVAQVVVQTQGPGPATLAISVDGDDIFAPASIEVGISVVTRFTAIQFLEAPIQGHAGDLVDVRAGLSGSSTPNGIVGGRLVTFTVEDGEGNALSSAQGVTDGTGEASASLLLPTAGAHMIVARFDGDASFSPSSASWSITVLRGEAVLTPDGPDSVMALEPATLRALLTHPSTGAGIPGREITFKVTGNGTDVELLGTTGADGVAQAVTTLEGAAVYTLTESFAGDDDFAPASITTELIVAPRPARLEYAGPESVRNLEEFTVIARLVDDASGAAVSGARVGMNVAGSHLFGDTNAEGLVEFVTAINVEPGTYPLTLSFQGGPSHAETSKTVDLVVRWPHSFTDSSTGAQILLDPIRQKLKFVAPGDEPEVKEISMQFLIGVYPDQVAVLAFTDDELTISGEFPLNGVNAFVAFAKTANATYLLRGV